MSSDDTMGRLAIDFAERHPRDTATLLLTRPKAEVTAFLESAPAPVAAAILESLPIVSAGHFVSMLTPADAARVLAPLPADQAAHVLRGQADPWQTDVLGELPADVARRVRVHLEQRLGTVGAIMLRRPACVTREARVADALDQLQSQSIGAIPYVYVVDSDGRLSGAVNLEDLMKADPATPVTTHMRSADARLQASASAMAARGHQGWHQHTILPVVDAKGVIVGSLDFRSLTGDRQDSTGQSDSVGAALGELYQIGLAGFLQAASGGMQQSGDNER